MKKNINNSDRIVRIFIAALLISISQLNLTYDSLLDLILLIAGCYCLLTMFLNHCFIYAFLDHTSIKPKITRKKYKNL